MKRVVALLAAIGPLVALDVHAQAPAPFELVARGPTLQSSVGMSRAGYRLMVDLGAESAGIRTFDARRWLLTWDMLAALRGGWLANQEPYLSLAGVAASAWGEPAYRFGDGVWSPVVSARLGGDASVMWHPGLSLAELRTRNDMDGVGGAFGRALARAGGGASFLDDTRSLLLQGFVQESFQSHGVNTDAMTFTELGVSGRFDWTWGLSASLETTLGTSPTLEDAALRRSDRTTRVGVAGGARKLFDGGLWLGLFGSLRRDSAHVTYEASGTRFDTATPADVTLGGAVGFSPSPGRRR